MAAQRYRRRSMAKGLRLLWITAGGAASAIAGGCVLAFVGGPNNLSACRIAAWGFFNAGTFLSILVIVATAFRETRRRYCLRSPAILMFLCLILAALGWLLRTAR